MPVIPVGAAAATRPAAIASEPSRKNFAEALRPHAPAQGLSTAKSPTSSRAVAALSQVDRAQARLDAVLAAARSGRTFTAAELIGLQAEAYRCAQTVDLASKLVEQGAQSVKQALNTQL